jgi:hypothetical protein
MAETKYLAGAELLRVSRTQQYLRYPLNLAQFYLIVDVSFLALCNSMVYEMYDDIIRLSHGFLEAN